MKLIFYLAVIKLVMLYLSPMLSSSSKDTEESYGHRGELHTLYWTLKEQHAHLCFMKLTGFQYMGQSEQSTRVKFNPLWCLPLPSVCLPFIKMHMVQSMTSPRKEVSSCILIWIRFTNERHSTTIGTIGLPRVARSMFTLIGSCRIYSIFQIKAGRFRKRYRSCNRFARKQFVRVRLPN